MLPFTKRPGRDDEDVDSKDDIVSAAVPVPPGSKRSVAPPPLGSSPAAAPATVRPYTKSVPDDELTQLMPTKALGNSGAIAAIPSPRPAAGAPPPSRSVPPPAKSSANRSGKFEAQQQEDDDDGRTVVRGAPKIVKRGAKATNSGMGMPTAPTTISPAAVIKATLDSARASKRTGEHLMAPPPADLLEDRDDKIDVHPADVGAERTAILSTTGANAVAPSGMIQGVQALSPQMLQPQPVAHGSIPPGSARPMSVPPAAPSSHAQMAMPLSATQSGGYAVPYNNPPSAPLSVPGNAQSMPAHFMVPQAPYSDGRIDPPATAVTARTKVAGRPATSWAVALLAFGLFVGVGAVAVMRGHADGFMETSASFVDPSRAAKAAAAQPPPAAADPTPVPVAAEAPSTVAVAPVAVPATPPAIDPNAPPATPPAAAPAAPPPVVAAAAPAAPPAAAATPAPAEKTDKTEKKPVAAAAPVRTAAAPVSRPVRPAAPVEEKEPVAAAPAKPAKPAKAAPAPGGKGDAELEAEQKKALKALQDSQLESTF